MRFYLIWFCFCTQAFVFGQIASQEDSVKAVQETEAKRRLKERLEYYNDRCKADSLRAVNDSKTQNKYYMNIAAPNGDLFIPVEELKEILKKHHIVWGGEWMGSDIGGYAPNSCYYEYMTEFTIKKFGQDFINNLVRKSVSEYVERHPEKIFDQDEHTDWKYKGTYTDFEGKDLLNKDFAKGFIYPENYDYTKNKYDSQTIVILNLDRTGKVLKIVEFYHHIYNHNNEKYIPYFEKEIKKFINLNKFEPLEYKGYPVKSKIALRFFYK